MKYKNTLKEYLDYAEYMDSDYSNYYEFEKKFYKEYEKITPVIEELEEEPEFIL